ncbi:hypothetical protein BH11BAC5_BH11BAC5_55610 [soil metagenome]
MKSEYEILREHDAQRTRLCAVGELANCLPGTEAKLVIKI